MMLELLDIANYYRLKLWCSDGEKGSKHGLGNKHYVDFGNRPSGHRYLETAWLAAHPDDTTNRAVIKLAHRRK